MVGYVNIKDRAERGPFVYILAATISVSGAAVGISEYFCRQRIGITTQRSALEICTLQSELTSIRRGLGDSKCLDIRTFVHTKDLPGTPPINPKSKFMASEAFYARTDLPGWTYEALTSEKFMEKYYGAKLAPTIRKYSGEFPIRVWTAPKLHTVEAKLDEESNYFTATGPQITLQRIPFSAPARGAEHFPEILEEQTGEKVEFTPDGMKDARAYLERMFRGDAAALHLRSAIERSMWPGFTPQINTQIVEVQKVGNVVYAQFLHTLHGPTVDKKTVPIFFLREETIIITDQDTSTVISVGVPIDDPAPRGAVYSQIQEWFSGLAVVVK